MGCVLSLFSNFYGPVFHMGYIKFDQGMVRSSALLVFFCISDQCKKTSQFITQCKSDICIAFKTARITANFTAPSAISRSYC